jgi:hypothetical protein
LLLLLLLLLLYHKSYKATVSHQQLLLLLLLLGVGLSSKPRPTSCSSLDVCLSVVQQSVQVTWKQQHVMS